jgi:protein SCO1/2
MFKTNHTSVISFIILIFGIYAVPKIISRIQNGEVVKGIVWTMLKIQMYQRDD